MQKDFRWISILLTAEQHKELSIMALTQGANLGTLGKKVFEEFLENKEWQSQVISKISE